MVNLLVYNFYVNDQIYKSAKARNQRPASGTRNEKHPTRLKPEIGSGSGLKNNFFWVRVSTRVSTLLFGSGSGLKTKFFSEKY